jgi:hypothetical protein
MSDKHNLGDQWKAFWNIVLDPWVVLLFIATICLSVILIIGQPDKIVVAILTFLVSLFSGILGGIVAKRWDDISQEKVIETRGKLANRGLNLLLSNVIGMERRVRLYLQRYTDSKYKKYVSSEVLKTYFEEIVEKCVILEENVINSIEDWTDILPDAEIKSVVDLMRDLKEKYSNSVSELEKVNNSLQETREKTGNEIDKLKAEKKKITEELTRIEGELRDKTRQVGIPAISGSLITGSTASPVVSGYGLEFSGSGINIDDLLNSPISKAALAASYLAQDREKNYLNVTTKEVVKKK